MKAVRIHTPGGPEALRYEDVPDPTPKPGHAVVKVDAAGLNYIDVYYRSGLYKTELPMTLGMEAGGTVTAVGPDVTQVKAGDKVAYTGVPGAYAEYALVPADRLVVMPAGLSAKQGAAAMLQGMTAHYLACSTWSTPRPVAWGCSSARSPRCAAPASSGPSPPRTRPSSRGRPAPTR